MTAVRLRADASISGNDTDIRIGVGKSRSTSPHLPRCVPFFIPREQAYYWTSEWQEDEAKALEELERGEGMIFYNPAEAVRWLRSSE
jgi:hypothetical protein